MLERAGGLLLKMDVFDMTTKMEIHLEMDMEMSVDFPSRSLSVRVITIYGVLSPSLDYFVNCPLHQESAREMRKVSRYG